VGVWFFILSRRGRVIDGFTGIFIVEHPVFGGFRILELSAFYRPDKQKPGGKPQKKHDEYEKVGAVHNEKSKGKSQKAGQLDGLIALSSLVTRYSSLSSKLPQPQRIHHHNQRTHRHQKS
jgi:hypothetical protein